MTFYTVLLQIHSGNCLQKIDLLDLSLIKLLQTNKGAFFMPHSVVYLWSMIRMLSSGIILEIQRELNLFEVGIYLSVNNVVVKRSRLLLKRKQGF